MTRELYINYLNESVALGVPHLTESGRLFFHYGVVVDVSEEFIFLKNKDILVKVPLKDILFISLSKHHQEGKHELTK